MLQPINYQLQGLNASEAWWQGGQQMNKRINDIFVNRQAMMQEKARQAEYERQQQMIAELKTLDLDNMDEMDKFVARYPKMSEGVQGRLAGLKDEERKSLASTVQKDISMIKSGRTDLVIAEWGKRADIARAEGDAEEAEGYKQMIQLAKIDPDIVHRSLMMSLPALTGMSMKEVGDFLNPQYKEVDTGSHKLAINVDPVTGEMKKAYEFEMSADPNTIYKGAVDVATNTANNTTSRQNTIDNNASRERVAQLKDELGRYGIQVEQAKNKQEYEMQAKKLAYQQQQERKKNERGKFQSFGGKVYITYPDGRAELAIDENNNPITDMPTSIKKPTEAQLKNDGFGERMQEANRAIDALEKQGITRTAISSNVSETYANVMPSFLGGNSKEQQQYQQLQRDFITAVLRRESGAVIGDDEFERYQKMYFPQIGDPQSVIEQKARARKLAIKGVLGAGSGKIEYLDSYATKHDDVEAMLQ